jgi:hypothetical protein
MASLYVGSEDGSVKVDPVSIESPTAATKEATAEPPSRSRGSGDSLGGGTVAGGVGVDGTSEGASEGTSDDPGAGENDWR